MLTEGIPWAIMKKEQCKNASVDRMWCRHHVASVKPQHKAILLRYCQGCVEGCRAAVEGVEGVEA